MRNYVLGAIALALAATPRPAHAFCGFYVSGSGEKLFNEATEVVLLRDGTRTVLSMQNDYKGPLEDFAMVVPVPVVLHEKDVKTLPREVFEHTDALGTPRLVEYWEQDPCPKPRPEREYAKSAKYDEGAVLAEDRAMPAPPPAVKIEAKFTVGEYNILILSATDSSGLERWLTANHYKIPPGAEPLLRPYVEGGMKFFVARVDPKKVHLGADGHAALSPLRFHYDSDDFSLPIRLGMANSSGKQDLIVNIISADKRYEVANYKNVFIPTNFDVKESAKTRFAEFYAALFDRTVESNPGAVVTEYAWQASTCDPCPGPTLDASELMTLGGDVMDGQHTYDLVLTRLHARYGKEIKDDLVFAAAPPIAGGREWVQNGGQLEQGAQAAQTNNFQGRYAIRHAWTGPIRCEHPQRGVWGGPPPELALQTPAVKPAVGLAFVPRTEVKLAAALVGDAPDLGIRAESSGGSKPKSGCGCQTSDPQGALALGLGTALLLVRRPGRRRTR